MPTGRATFDDSGTTLDVTLSMSNTLTALRFAGNNDYRLTNNAILTIGSAAGSSGISNASSTSPLISSTNDLRFTGNAALSGGAGHMLIQIPRGSLAFADHSSLDGNVLIFAVPATVVAVGGVPIMGSNTSVSFRNESFAADGATFRNWSGSAFANGTGGAASATGGISTMSFADDSHADGTLIWNFGGRASTSSTTGSATASGGLSIVTFAGNSHADDGEIRNFGGESFPDGSATAGVASTATGASALLVFSGNSHSDDTAISNLSGVVDASGHVGAAGTPAGTGNAGGAVTVRGSDAITGFTDNSHADRATIINQTGGKSAPGH